MGFNVNKVGRTEITLFGEFPKQVATKLFESVCQTRLASMGYEYDPDEDKTTLKFYPCVIQDVEYEVSYGEKTDHGKERRIVMIGAIPQFINIVDSYWSPIRSRAKKDKKALKWVVMYAPARITTPYGEAGTELTFITDCRCDADLVDSVLDEAAEAMRDKLQLICKDVNPAIMSSAHLLDEITMDMADKLHKLEDDATAKRYAEKGLRKFDTDELIFGNDETIPSAR